LDLHKIDGARNHHEPLIERKKKNSFLTLKSRRNHHEPLIEKGKIEEQLQRRAYVKKPLKSPPRKYEGNLAHTQKNTKKNKTATRSRKVCGF